MMKREVRIYNMIIPLWLLWLFPPLFPWVLPIILLGNLAIDTAVLSLALKAMKRTDREQLMEHLWWRIWWRGFAADAAGIGPPTGGDIAAGAGRQQAGTEVQAQKQTPFFHTKPPPLPV